MAKKRTRIEWNKETWYSRMLFLAVLTGFSPFVGFFIGVQYQQTAQTIIDSNGKDMIITITHVSRQ